MTKKEYLEEKNYTVYMHKNKTNGKIYIGITNGGYHWRYYEE